MIKDWLDSLVSLGLFSNVDLSFNNDLSVKAYHVVQFVFFALVLFNIWVALKFFLKKVI